MRKGGHGRPFFIAQPFTAAWSAYHSVENIGIILIGIGLSMVFIGSGHPVAGALGRIDGNALNFDAGCRRSDQPICISSESYVRP